MVGRLLIQLEDAIDQTFSISSLLGAALVDARRERKLSAVVGQQVFEAAARITTAVSAARGEVVGTHRLLDALARRIGLDPQAYGDGSDKPAPGFVEPTGAAAG